MKIYSILRVVNPGECSCDEGYCYCPPAETTIIGSYKSESRARLVLQELHLNQQKIKHYDNDEAYADYDVYESELDQEDQE